MFGIHQLPDRTKLLSTRPDPSFCYAFGKINVTAGVARRILGGNVSSKHTVDTPRPNNLEPNMWANQALKMLPDILWRMGSYNLSAVPRYNNLDNYIKSSIQIAYTAAWAYSDQHFGPQRPQIVLKRSVPLV
jgi:hypothetical protein